MATATLQEEPRMGLKPLGESLAEYCDMIIRSAAGEEFSDMEIRSRMVAAEKTRSDYERHLKLARERRQSQETVEGWPQAQRELIGMTGEANALEAQIRTVREIEPAIAALREAERVAPSDALKSEIATIRQREESAASERLRPLQAALADVRRRENEHPYHHSTGLPRMKVMNAQQYLHQTAGRSYHARLAELAAEAKEIDDALTMAGHGPDGLDKAMWDLEFKYNRAQINVPSAGDIVALARAAIANPASYYGTADDVSTLRGHLAHIDALKERIQGLQAQRDEVQKRIDSAPASAWRDMRWD